MDIYNNKINLSRSFFFFLCFPTILFKMFIINSINVTVYILEAPIGSQSQLLKCFCEVMGFLKF